MTNLLKNTLQVALSHPKSYIQSRAQIILLTLNGQALEEISSEVGVTEQTVKKWQDAWEVDGITIFPPEIQELLNEEVVSPPEVASTTQVSPSDLKTLPIEDEDFRERLSLKMQDDLAVAADDPMWEAGRKLLLQNLQQLLIEEKQIWDGDAIEGVHQVRVALRRMRSIFDVFGQYFSKHYYADIYPGLRKTAKRLGKVRDLDVFLLKTQSYIDAELDGDASSLEEMIAYIQEQQRVAQKALHKWLKQEKYDRFIQDFYDLLSKPGKGGRKKYRKLQTPPLAYQVNHVVPRLIYEQMEVIWAYEPFLATAEVATLHELRIEFKRLRYLLEFFSDVMGDDIKIVIKATRKMQNYLGDLNDADVAITLLKSLRHDFANQKGIKKYIKHRRQEHDNLYENFMPVWEMFNDAQVHRALGLAIADL